MPEYWGFAFRMGRCTPRLRRPRPWTWPPPDRTLHTPAGPAPLPYSIYLARAALRCLGRGVAWRRALDRVSLSAATGMTHVQLNHPDGAARCLALPRVDTLARTSPLLSSPHPAHRAARRSTREPLRPGHGPGPACNAILRYSVAEKPRDAAPARALAATPRSSKQWQAASRRYRHLPAATIRVGIAAAAPALSTKATSGAAKRDAIIMPGQDSEHETRRKGTARYNSGTPYVLEKIKNIFKN